MSLFVAILTAWTNTASRVILAEPVKLDGASVTLKLESGRERVFPLAVFPENERARLKSSLGERDLPIALEELRKTFAADLLRTEQRHAGGAMTDEEFGDKVNRLYIGWARALGQSALPQEDKDFWKGKLK